MSKDECIKEFLIKLKNIFFKPEEFDNQLIEGFNRYILEKYKLYFDEIKEGKIDDIDKQIMIDYCIRNKDLSLEDKKAMFLTDENFEKLKSEFSRIHFQAYNKLVERPYSLDGLDIKKKIEELEELSKRVFEWNSYEASRLLSETILDLNYLFDIDKDKIGFELHKDMEFLKKNK